MFSPDFKSGNKPAFFILFILFCKFSIAQNLVYNGDFEEYSSCPTGPSYPQQSIKEIEKCIGWTAPTYGTSDYFHSCSSNPGSSIPSNSVGNQFAFNGNGYTGGAFTSYTGGSGTDGYNGIMWWEYVQGRLVSPLETGKIYKLSMELSLAELSDLYINEIGAYFSEDQVSSKNTAALTIIPQCTFYEPNYFKDTMNWMHLESYFLANGNEKFITIGNFKDNITTDTLRRYNIEPLNPNPYVTYFYIDEVVLEEATTNISNVFTPNKDGINDIWKFPFDQGEGFHNISIVNRWGNLIYQADLHDFQWDGTTASGGTCEEGTYFYRISNTNIAGFIQLIR